MSHRTWPEETPEQQPLLDEDNSNEEPRHVSRLIDTQHAAAFDVGGQRGPSVQKRPTRLFSVFFITIATMTLHTVLRLVGVDKAADATLAFNYLAMLAYIAVLQRAGEPWA